VYQFFLEHGVDAPMKTCQNIWIDTERYVEDWMQRYSRWYTREYTSSWTERVKNNKVMCVEPKTQSDNLCIETDLQLCFMECCSVTGTGTRTCRLQPSNQC